MSENADKIREIILGSGDKGESLTQIVGILTTLKEDEISAVVKEVVESFIVDYRPVVLGILKSASEIIPNNVIIPLVNFIMESYLVCLEDKDTISLGSKIDKVKAASIVKKITVYEKAGLSREEAVKFVMQEIANIKAFVSDINDRARDFKSALNK